MPLIWWSVGSLSGKSAFREYSTPVMLRTPTLLDRTDRIREAWPPLSRVKLSTGIVSISAAPLKKVSVFKRIVSICHLDLKLETYIYSRVLENTFRAKKGYFKR